MRESNILGDPRALVPTKPFRPQWTISKQEPPKPGFVYIMAVEGVSNVVKIGRAFNVKRREQQLRRQHNRTFTNKWVIGTANPGRLEKETLAMLDGLGRRAVVEGVPSSELRIVGEEVLPKLVKAMRKGKITKRDKEHFRQKFDNRMEVEGDP